MFGIADVATRFRAEHLTVVMLLFVIPQVAFYFIAFLGAAAQQARGHFALAAAAPAVENIGVIATVAVVGLTYGSGIDFNYAPVGLVIMLCLGSTLSVLLHMALQLVGAARAGLPIRPRLRRSDSETAEITRRLRQAFVVAASPEAAYFGLLAIAGTVPGGVLVLQMAYQVYSLAVALGGRSVSTAVLPGLSAAVDGNDRTMFAEKAREGIAYAFIASLPPLFLLTVFASPLADILANGRLRVGGLIHSLAECLVVLALAQLAAGLHEVGRQGLFAWLDIRGPRIAALLALSVTLVVGLATLLGLAGTDRLIGLAAAVLVGDVVAAATVILLLRRVVRPQPLADRKRLGAAALAATVMLPLVAGGWLLVDVQHGNRIVDFLIIAVTSVLALAAVRFDDPCPASKGGGIIIRVRADESLRPVADPSQLGLIAGAAIATSVAAGIAAAIAGPATVVVAAGAGVFGLVAWRPVLATYLYPGDAAVPRGHRARPAGSAVAAQRSVIAFGLGRRGGRRLCPGYARR